MASGDERARVPDDLSGHGLSIAIIRSRWNAGIVERLVAGVHRALRSMGVTDIEEHSVPGCFEIPLAAKVISESRTVDGIVCVGAVIRGETTHYEIVSEECARGVQRVQLDTGVPVAFGVVTVENEAQALARSEGPGGHNVGEEAALVAVEMAVLVSRWSS
jgi:6,7-dimethyl-8-ribityllumazine synthase